MGMKTIIIHVSNGLNGCDRKRELEIPDEDWEEMTEKQRDELMLDELFDMIEWTWYEKGTTETDEEN